VVAVTADHLPHYLVLFSTLQEVGHTAITQRYLQCLGHVINANAHGARLKPVYSYSQFRLIEFKVNIEALENWAFACHVHKLWQVCSQLVEINILDNKLNRQAATLGGSNSLRYKRIGPAIWESPQVTVDNIHDLLLG